VNGGWAVPCCQRLGDEPEVFHFACYTALTVHATIVVFPTITNRIAKERAMAIQAQQFSPVLRIIPRTRAAHHLPLLFVISILAAALAYPTAAYADMGPKPLMHFSRPSASQFDGSARPVVIGLHFLE